MVSTPRPTGETVKRSHFGVIVISVFTLAVIVGIAVAGAADSGGTSRTDGAAAEVELLPGLPPQTANGLETIAADSPEGAAAVTEGQTDTRDALAEAAEVGPAPHGVYRLPAPPPAKITEACRERLAKTPRGTGDPSDTMCQAAVLVADGKINGGTYTPEELERAITDAGEVPLK